MDGAAQLVLDEVEVRRERAINGFAGVRVPADDDLLVVGGIHDLPHDRELRGAPAMDFDADLLPVPGGERAALMQRLADAGDGDVARLAVDKSVGADLDSGAAQIVRELDELF